MQPHKLSQEGFCFSNKFLGPAVLPSVALSDLRSFSEVGGEGWVEVYPVPKRSFWCGAMQPHVLATLSYFGVLVKL
ncbi:MAG: hypothetical protein A2826_03005 [Candidatus Doudnabacteria bacterium RIFCSPHIGHO2_01_FULL_43_23]|uniref:Uncharacterized protein n=1 Tax=Candidatus Doudnabacteria bacterium RIFCSPHIGHO2_01_FULL_43_23 TaxID=1817822 RepID=A0A1F5NW51_9BACT|nr:MAG: hypothetical protein A2826_03005 [Candidatus Doudnabacteria bacterium RIFCSPHIGHO2_01_FULL_43_23]